MHQKDGRFILSELVRMASTVLVAVLMKNRDDTILVRYAARHPVSAIRCSTTNDRTSTVARCGNEYDTPPILVYTVVVVVW